MTWRVARSLDQLLAQINAAAPNRSKASDGAIGDAAHASRTSDHNPWVKLGDLGIVTARDFTHDPAGGLDVDQLFAALIASRDPRLKYLIRSRRYWTPGHGWRPYDGINAHDKHGHVSVSPAPLLFDSVTPWRITTMEDDLTPEQDRLLREVHDKLSGVADQVAGPLQEFQGRTLAQGLKWAFQEDGSPLLMAAARAGDPQALAQALRPMLAEAVKAGQAAGSKAQADEIVDELAKRLAGA